MLNLLRLLLPGLILALFILPLNAQEDIPPLEIGATLTETHEIPVQYALPLQAGEPVSITAQSADFDILLEVFDAGGVLVASDDDSARGLEGANPTDATLVYNPVADGFYTVVVRQVGADAPAGTFTLTVEAAKIDDPLYAGELIYGEPLTAQPQQAQRVIATFTAVGGEVITIGAESVFEDLVLSLYDSSGTLIARDDDSGLRLNPTILRQPLTEAGDYDVIVEGYNGALLREPITLSVTRTNALLLDEGPHTLNFGLARPVERLVLDVEKGDVFIITLEASRLLNAPISLTIYEEGVVLPVTEMRFNGATTGSIAYVATNSGRSEIFIAYSVFLDENLSVTANATPVE